MYIIREGNSIKPERMIDMIDQNKFNYAKVYKCDGSGSILKKGFVDHWCGSFNGNMIDLSFTDGAILKVPVQYVFLLSKDTSDEE